MSNIAARATLVAEADEYAGDADAAYQALKSLVDRLQGRAFAMLTFPLIETESLVTGPGGSITVVLRPRQWDTRTALDMLKFGERLRDQAVKARCPGDVQYPPPARRLARSSGRGSRRLNLRPKARG